jgi:dihydrofolate reductase
MQKQLADQLDITLVHDTFEADVYFPEIDTKIWEEVAKQKHFADEKNKYDYSFITYKKK